MAISTQIKKLISEISQGSLKFGELKKRAKEIKKDHSLAEALWASGEYRPRLLATLIFDKKLLTESSIKQLELDLQSHDEEERNQLSEWLLANQLMKDKKLVAMMETWREEASPIFRRLYWYHQARLRWTGRTPPPENSDELLGYLENSMANEEPQVQWAMNFCAGQIGVFEPKLRSRCVKLGKKTGRYQDEQVAKNCTPSYLPEFIRIEVAKRE